MDRKFTIWKGGKDYPGAVLKAVQVGPSSLSTLFKERARSDPNALNGFWWSTTPLTLTPVREYSMMEMGLLNSFLAEK